MNILYLKTCMSCYLGHSMPTQPILRKVPWAPPQILLKIASNVPPWKQWKIPMFQTKIPSGLDFIDFWTVRATTHFCLRGFESRRTIYSYLDFVKNSSFRLPYQRPSSSAICARELLNGSKESARLVDYSRKKIFWLGVRIFCDWRHKWSSFRVILAHVARPGAQPLSQSASLKFSLETRLESESFEPLIDFLAFLVQKLRSKINKLIN